MSFLGLGITEPTPTWGNMISSGQIVLREAPWLTVFPGAAIVLTVLAFNLLGMRFGMRSIRRYARRGAYPRRKEVAQDLRDRIGLLEGTQVACDRQDVQ